MTVRGTQKHQAPFSRDLASADDDIFGCINCFEQPKSVTISWVGQRDGRFLLKPIKYAWSTWPMTVSLANLGCVSILDVKTYASLWTFDRPKFELFERMFIDFFVIEVSDPGGGEELI